MTKTQKAEIIDSLSVEFKDASSVIFCDYKGLTVSELEELRKAARAKDSRVQVVKNSLSVIALEKAELTGIALSNTNILVWSNDTINACKVAVDFAKTNEKFEVKSGYVAREASDVANVEAYAKLPGREELLGMLAATWMAPLTNFVFGIDAVRKKKEEEAA